jgi:hypothetical protein
MIKAQKWASAVSPASSPSLAGGGGAGGGGPASPAVLSASDAEAFGRRVPYASDYRLSGTTASGGGGGGGGGGGAGYGGSRPVSRAAARDHFTTTSKKAFAGKPARPEYGSGHGMATLRPSTSHSSGSGRFSEALRPSDGRIHSRVNHFEPGADAFTYGGGVVPDPSVKAPFGTTGARFVESTVVHQGLIDGYTATEAARGIKPGKLVASNATSASNPLATSVYQVRVCALARVCM